MPIVQPFVPLEPPKIAIVGEAPGKSEVMQGKPFVGAAGQELTEMLRYAGINRFDCYITNVFWRRPPNNSIEAFCVSKRNLPPGYTLPYLRPGKYFAPEYLETSPEERDFVDALIQRMVPPSTACVYSYQTVIQRLAAELQAIKPNIVIALGNTACWALLGETAITKIRGTLHTNKWGFKVLPTFHPASVLRQWSQRSVAIADLQKAKQESLSPELTVPKRELVINPTIEELEAFVEEAQQAEYLSFDIETEGGTISMIGFSPSPDKAFVVPFLDRSNPNYEYWSRDEFKRAVKAVVKLLSSSVPKIAQNGLYDIQYLYAYGFPVNNFQHDTMIAHHAAYPEMPKSLAFLGSLYTNEISWKNLRPRGMTTKEDE